ncbi:MAG: ClpXP protease specificity-enhancing factor [Gammaproteobacteria bacterium]|nr:ClpXP protease specificity-enhancing factor [Gammaproteobacteria bacterium]
MTSNRPYLIRAIHAWVVDNDCTPYLLVDANAAGVAVPTEHVEEGRIVLNISPRATEHLELGDETISFRARFGGRPTAVHLPVGAVLAIYARENGQGMMFPPDEGGGGDDEPPPDKPSGDGSRPALKVVK